MNSPCNTLHLSRIGRALATALVAVLASSASALPVLQLDVYPGIYVGGSDQTTIALANPFTLRALIDGSRISLARNYYISAAIIPGTASPDFGSFTINDTTYSAFDGNMQYGVPPVDDALRNLQTHAVFPTWYAEVMFGVSASSTMAAYNVQDGTSAPGVLNYVDFTVNIEGLAGQPNSPYAVHFDLYTYDDIGTKIDCFAPFSHDAESSHGLTIVSEPNPVPDGGTTLLLLGSALTGVAVLRRKLGAKVE